MCIHRRTLGPELPGILVGTGVEWEKQELHPTTACPAGENPLMTPISHPTARCCHPGMLFNSQIVTHLPFTRCHRFSFCAPSNPSLKDAKTLGLAGDANQVREKKKEISEGTGIVRMDLPLLSAANCHLTYSPPYCTQLQTSWIRERQRRRLLYQVNLQAPLCSPTTVSVNIQQFSVSGLRS